MCLLSTEGTSGVSQLTGPTYCVVEGENLQDLAERVRLYQSEGWQPSGGVAYRPDHVRPYFQAMTATECSECGDTLPNGCGGEYQESSKCAINEKKQP